MKLRLILLIGFFLSSACAVQHNDSEKLHIEYKVDTTLISHERDTIILCCPSQATDGGGEYLRMFAKFPSDERILSYGITNEDGTTTTEPNKYQDKDFGSTCTGFLPLNKKVA